MDTRTVVGLFDYYSDADKAVQALQEYGLDNSRISVVARDGDTIKTENVSATGAKTGAVAGGLVGLLAGLSTLLIPGIGPVFATGVLANTIATTLGATAVGAGLGAATGGLLGALVDLGFSEEEAGLYAEGVKRGGILVYVQAEAEDEDQIRDILRGAGSVDMDTRRQTWHNEGWTRFEETESSDEDSYRR